MEGVDTRIKCVLLGNENTGKTSLLNRYMDDVFSLTPQATVGCSFKSNIVKCNGTDVKLDIWDTAGQERYRSILSMYYRNARVVLLCIDLSGEDPIQNINYWLGELDNNCDIDDRVVYIVGTKSDIRSDDIADEISQYASDNDYTYFETSSKLHQNISPPFIEGCMEAWSIIVETNTLVNVDLATDELRKLLESHNATPKSKCGC